MHRLLISILILICIGCNTTDAGLDKKITEKDFKSKNIRSIAVTNTGEYFYAISSIGVVAKYQILPFKKISSFQMPTPVFPFHKYSVRSLFVTPDEEKLILYNKKGIVLLDLVSQEILNTIEFKEFSSGLALINNRIVTLFAGQQNKKTLFNEWQPDKPFSPCTTELRTFDSRTLKALEVISYDEASYCGKLWHYRENDALLARINESLIFILEPKSKGFPYPYTEKYSRLVIFDVKTLTPEIILSYNKIKGNSIILSDNFETLKIINAMPYNGKAFDGTNYHTLSQPGTAFINLQTYQFEVGGKKYNNSELLSNIITVHNKRNAIQVIPINSFVAHGNKLIDVSNGKEYIVYVFPDGEAVMHDIRKDTFKLTKKAKYHLNIK